MEKYYTISARKVYQEGYESDWVPANQYIYTDPEVAKKDMDDLIMGALNDGAEVERQHKIRKRFYEIIKLLSETKDPVAAQDFAAEWSGYELHLTIGGKLLEYALAAFANSEVKEDPSTLIFPEVMVKSIASTDVKEHTVIYTIMSNNFRLNEFELKTK